MRRLGYTLSAAEPAHSERHGSTGTAAVRGHGETGQVWASANRGKWAEQQAGARAKGTKNGLGSGQSSKQASPEDHDTPSIYTPWLLPESSWQETIGPIQLSFAVHWWGPLPSDWRMSLEGTVAPADYLSHVKYYKARSPQTQDFPPSSCCLLHVACVWHLHMPLTICVEKNQN